jgi:hypothetical protein
MKPEAQRIAIAEACPSSRFSFEPPHKDGYVVIKYEGQTKMRYWPSGSDIADRLELAGVPDYLSDLNAMHKAEITFESNPNKDAQYWQTLYKVLDGEFENGEPCDGPPHGHWCELKQVGHATAAQRAEAFLRTIGKWEES